MKTLYYLALALLDKVKNKGTFQDSHSTSAGIHIPIYYHVFHIYNQVQGLEALHLT